MTIRPGIGWLSSSSDEIMRARNVLRALTPGGVIDELGFLMLQGAFADQFYPAVTTPMTRARYLIFIPAIYQHLEESGMARRKDVDRISRDLQYQLLEALLKNEPTAIGKESGRAIVRPPSALYWNALAVLGVATQRLSESGYQKHLNAGTMGMKVWRDEDDAAHIEETDALWNQEIRLSHVMPGGAFPENTDFRLRNSEATFLRAGYAALKPGGNDCLITHLVTIAQEGRIRDVTGIGQLWDIPFLPGETEKAATHARLLSLFARGTTLQYHRMLIEKRGEEDPGASEAFVAWWERARDDLAKWDIDAFFALLQKWGEDRRRERDRQFITGWIERCIDGRNGQALLDDSTARKIISGREDHVRPGKQRLKVKYQLDSWRLMPAYRLEEIYQLGYRHSVGRQFAQDIADGLEQEGK